MRNADGTAEVRAPRAPNGSPAPYGTAIPGQIPEGMLPQRTIPGRVFQPRTADASPTGAPTGEARRPPGANRQAEGAAAATPRPAGVAAPAAVAPGTVAPAVAPPAAPRAPSGEGRMTRPEAPHGRGEERREDKAEKQR
jgi:hypothetical protein